MSTYGTFEIEDSDIVRLDGRMDGDNDGRSRAGWVNVGAFALRIELGRDGDLTVAAYPCGNESQPLVSFTATHADAMAAGAIDNAADNGDDDYDGPFYVMIDGEQSVAECPTLADARIDGRALADAEALPCTFSIHDADGNHVEDIKRTDGADLPALVNAFNAAHPTAKVFEVTAAGFDGSDDETDDRVYWVLADSREQVAEAIKDCGAVLRNQWDEQGDAAIDFDLRKPGQAMQFGTKLLEWVSYERNKNRAC